MATPNDTSHDHSHAQNRFAVIPTADRLAASRVHSGRGVRIAFLDSGFYPHPDFVDRVAAFHDVTGSEGSLTAAATPAAHHWHGTQTVVACAGDGSLSDGVYRGLAYAAELVLVKVSDKGRITDASIEQGLRWVLDNREKYDIRILNMSLGGDIDLRTSESCINRLTEKLVASGVVVTVAAGNSAETRSIPPANSPSVITVGGYDDRNQFEADNFDLYHSSHGPTADGLIKPEMIAPAMYVAAPILPETREYRSAEALSALAASPDYAFPRVLAEAGATAGIAGTAPDGAAARRAVEDLLVERKIVATHYQHVDGTSFAAPITASVAAQMIEANPGLTPPAIKNILISTASRLSGHPAVRQGFGVLNAGLAVERAAAEVHLLSADSYFPPMVDGPRIVFSFHDDDAERVDLCGDFNDWRDGIAFEKTASGIWTAAIPCLPPGTYRYKMLVDSSRWTEDPSHSLKEDDGLGGFNSILNIA